jgi:catechol 2,3-dioxygenase-like lactoylglutathione lyase family enzyme
MLAQERLVAFLSTADAERARAFYEGVLQLAFVGDHGHLVIFDSGPARLALVRSNGPVTPPPGTAMGWNVGDLRASVRALAARGVVFERVQGMAQDDLLIWSPVPGEGVAWFKDPDENRLSLNGPLL